MWKRLMTSGYNALRACCVVHTSDMSAAFLRAGCCWYAVTTAVRLVEIIFPWRHGALSVLRLLDVQPFPKHCAHTIWLSICPGGAPCNGISSYGVVLGRDRQRPRCGRECQSLEIHFGPGHMIGSMHSSTANLKTPSFRLDRCGIGQYI